MKTRIWALILAIVTFTLCACAPVSAAVGSWTLTEKTTNGTPDDLSELSVKYTFKKDGTFNMVVNGMDAAEGTYTFEDNILIWTVGDNSGYMTMVDGKFVYDTKVNDEVVVSVYEKN